MPRKSEKEDIIEFMIRNTILKLRSNDDTSSENEDADVIMDEFHDNLIAVLSHRYCIRMPRNRAPKLMHWHKNVLPQMDDNQFKEMLRVNREQFQHLLTLIKNSEVFLKAHSQKQLPVELQLAIILYRLGTASENISTRKIANFFGIGGGGTVDKITRRVFDAFDSMFGKYIHWPNETERSKIVKDTYKELPHCIGYIGATEIKFTDPPARNQKAYLNKNENYAIKLQIICDSTLRIRDVVVGNLGSFHDAEVFRNSVIYKQPKKFFSEGQWIAGDSSYPLLDTVITPYSSNSQDLNKTSRCQFNKRHVKYSARAAHCINLLKDRFCSLKDLKLRVENERGQHLCKKWIQICCMLHNILLSDDQDFKYKAASNQYDNALEDSYDSISDAALSAQNKRQKLYHIMFD